MAIMGGATSQVKEEWTVLEALRHARHDWMNDIQLVKGYLSLNKIDEAVRAADHIIVKAVQESKLCNLGMPGMAEMFITFNWEQHSFLLEFEIDDELVVPKVDDEKAVQFFSRLFSVLDQHIEEYSGQYLYAHFSEKEGRLSARIEWTGEVKDRALLVETISSLPAIPSLESNVLESSGRDILMEVNF